MISEPELARLAALIAQCAEPHCGNGPRNSLTSALHQCAPALIPELRRLRSENSQLVEALRYLVNPPSVEAKDATPEHVSAILNAFDNARALLRELGEQGE